MFGQPLSEEGAQAGGRGLGTGRLDQVGDQALAPGLILAQQHDDPLDTGMLAQDCFHLVQFDAEAAKLHLAVTAPDVFQLAISPVAGEVTGAVQPGARCCAERVGQKPFSGQLGVPEVAAGQAGTADVQLSDGSDGDRVHDLIKHIGLRIRNRAADGGGAARLRGISWAYQRPDGQCGGLGRPVVVEHSLDRRRAVKLVRKCAWHGLAGQVDCPH